MTVSLKDMPVGTYKKDTGVSTKMACEEPTCGKAVDMLFTLTLQNKDMKVCESCYKDYWLKNGYRV